MSSIVKIIDKTKIHGKTIFSTSGGGGGGGNGGDFVFPVDTTVYDSQGNVSFTINGNAPEHWLSNRFYSGYVVVGSSATIIRTAAFGSNSFTSVTMPNSVTSIGDNAFAYNQLTSATISNSVTSIGSDAFGYNQLTSITIPNSVTSIGNYAFVTNPNLATVNCYTTQTAFIGPNAFVGTASPLTIRARATDGTWTAGTGLEFQGNTNVTVVKNL